MPYVGWATCSPQRSMAFRLRCSTSSDGQSAVPAGTTQVVGWPVIAVIMS